MTLDSIRNSCDVLNVEFNFASNMALPQGPTDRAHQEVAKNAPDGK